MEIVSATEFDLATLGGLEVFRDLGDDALNWLREHGQRTNAQTDEFVITKGEPAEYMWVLVSGSIQWKFSVGTQTSVFVEAEPGVAGGMLPYSRAKEFAGSGQALEPSVAFRIHKDNFPEMLFKIPELGQRLVTRMADRIRTSTQIVDHREKMSALGKLSAGLAHELNNPASALARSASELGDCVTKVFGIGEALMSLGLSPDQIDGTKKYRDALIERSSDVNLSTMQRSEREDELSDWLEDHDVPKPWVMAEYFAELGATVTELDELAAKLGSIDNALVLSLQWIEGTTGAQQMVSEIRSAADRVSHLVQSIKVHSHMDSNPDRQRVDLRDGIESTLTILNHKIRKKSIKVVREFADELPKVPVYPGEMNQVWTNLIDNGIDAMSDGGTLTINTGVEGQCVCVKICDDGHGIPEDVKTNIFEPFFTTKSIGEGTGLGLDIVHRIVTQQHLGDIALESKPGRTCFTVWFPLEPK